PSCPDPIEPIALRTYSDLRAAAPALISRRPSMAPLSPFLLSAHAPYPLPALQTAPSTHSTIEFPPARSSSRSHDQSARAYHCSSRSSPRSAPHLPASAPQLAPTLLRQFHPGSISFPPCGLPPNDSPTSPDSPADSAPHSYCSPPRKVFRRSTNL